MRHYSVHMPPFTECDVLAVDLDGTLLRSDMLYESFWAASAARWTTPFIVLNELRKGRARLKHQLGILTDIDVSLLPYNDEVIAYVRRWREAGGRTLLVTASNRALAERIADHLGIFDEVHGSDEHTNLKGPQKARFLEDRYGLRGFAYMGDTHADLPVWEKAARIIAINPSRHLRQRIQTLNGDAEYLDGTRASAKAHVKALRPHQWLKNLLIFLPMVAAHQFDGDTITRSILAFIAFSLIASSVYVLNDLLDLSADRAHPRKRKRPFASGSIPIAHGTWMTAGLIVGGAGIALSLGWLFAFTMLGYYAITTAYSLNLKRRLIIDICVLAGLYTMRILAGGVATGIPLSVWLLAFSQFFFFSLAAVKRQAELVDAAGSGRLKAHGRGYHANDLSVVSQMAISSGFVSVLVMALYVNSPAVVTLYNNPSALWGICIILLYWISRMVMMTHRGYMHDDPIVYAVKDRNSQVCAVLIAICAIAGVFL